MDILATNPDAEADAVPEQDNTVDAEDMGVTDLDAELNAENGEEADDGETDDILGDILKEEEEPELVEVDYEGETFKLPPKLKDALLRQSDYTQKTQEVAETRKQTQAKFEVAEKIASISQETFVKSVEFAQLNAQIQQMEQMSVDGYSQEQINALRMDLADLQKAREQTGHYLSQAEQREAAARSEYLTSQRDECFKQAAREIPNFNTRREGLDALAVELGVSKDDIEQTTEPAAYKILHYAEIGRKYEASRKKSETMKTAQAGQPATKVGSRTNSGKAPEEMSMAEYIAARKSGQI